MGQDRATAPGDIVRIVGASRRGDPGECVVLTTGGLPEAPTVTVSALDPAKTAFQHIEVPASSVTPIRSAAAHARRAHRHELERASTMQATVEAARTADAAAADPAASE